jgi:hypothetical protein
VFLRKLECTGLICSESQPGELKLSKIARLVEGFEHSKAEFAQISGWTDSYSRLSSAKDAFTQAINRARLNERVMCCTIKGVLYLIRLY